MSIQNCSGITGFPITLSQNLFNAWPDGYNPADREVANQLVVPTDFSIAWAPATTIQVSVDTTSSQFKIQGLDTVATGTKLTYGGATYTCQPSMSIVKIQHANLIPNSPATQELIMTFRIDNAQTKQSNPSSPDVILLCRPVVLVNQTNIGSDFWKAVNTAALTANSQVQTKYNMAENFAYNATTLMPMITYETCIPTKLIGGPNNALEGSTRIRVHVVTQTMNIPSSDSGSGKCSRVSGFILPVNGLVNIFGQSGYTNVQFTNGTAADGTTKTYPAVTTPISDALTLSLPSANQITTWQSSSGIGSVLQTFEYLVPEVYLGKSLSEIARITDLPNAPATKKGYKCFTIDPLKDVVNDEILIDPTTGQSLKDRMNQQALEASGGDPALAAALAGQAAPNSGLLPGDIERMLLILVSTIGGALLLAYFFYIVRLFMVHNYHDGLFQSVIFGSILTVIIILSLALAHPNKPPDRPLPITLQN